ncbi:putative TYPE 4 FIMBRIAL PILIN RELATED TRANSMEMBRANE PROTEIN, pilE family [Cupriavidus taiwanensis]|uniref:Type II secretion system protein H n=1 Tax=Cupriavidus taiwanensis TaxID=164546 RepID=A0A375E3U6_9BURK|nr:GspH/FimT family pseudopilin [Cupriavidus taiwanensis]SOZ15086.1 putative TYPE 4 FIMBRIAL PILIN RELATED TRANSMEMBRANE PROTEIN, pilE family [Cupriavidus taiwanensis]SOZ27166.1 putative TYPE 4 FIMBRIAL PILIN RELATED TRANSMEMBRANE PROTEIN, pilE family [Cupriavidus taiwanensis]SOZ45659.1 putative TYPE 4 FIMBRIAL PILIN RELATED TRANSMEMBRANE PROTEIN, pilE family [Cupriavidus taiwanensis]SOZ60273.1 putative TYPE 4 FIMBRIAL PILIN RELATED TRANSMEMBRANE PROTEIN, pilE family [Cupriavidus taiwanensis]S
MRPNLSRANDRRPRARRGFTLIELLCALSVLAILAVAAAPSFTALIAGQRVRSASLDLASALVLARSEAVKRNATVSLAPAGAAWTAGWAVSVGAETVRSFGPYGGLAITPSAAGGLAVGNDGRLTGAAMTFEFAPAGDTSATTRVCVQVSETGRIASTNGACT